MFADKKKLMGVSIIGLVLIILVVFIIKGKGDLFNSNKYEYSCPKGANGCVTNSDPIGVNIRSDVSTEDLNKGKEVNLYTKFIIKDKTKQYYYLWETYNDGVLYYRSPCQKVNTNEKHTSLTIFGKRKGLFTIYGDSKCQNKISSLPTKFYNCKDCGPRFTVKYDSNGGKGSILNSVIFYGEEQALRKNVFTKNNNVFVGWAVYNETRDMWACYTNAKHTDQSYQKRDKCKYGLSIYKDQTKISKTAQPGEVIRMVAQWNSNIFTIKYDSNGGNGSMKDSIVIYGKEQKLRKNTFTKSGYNFVGWGVYNRSRDQWACYTDAKQKKQEYRKLSDCKYGLSIYSDQTKVSKTANVKETVVMIAQWNISSSAINRILGPMELKTNGNKVEKIMQDLHVEGKYIYISQDNWDKNPNELTISRINRVNNSKSIYYRGVRCGHGVFSISNGDVITTCDTPAEYRGDDHGSKIYKVSTNGSKTYIKDGFEGKREIIKVDSNSKLAVVRSYYSGKQNFRIFSFDPINNTIGSLKYAFSIAASPLDIQGLDVDGDKLYLYYGEGRTSGSHNTSKSSAYIDVYKLSTGALIKKNHIFTSNDYREAEGLDVYGGSVYIGVATTSDARSPFGNKRYATVYEIAKNKLYE